MDEAPVRAGDILAQKYRVDRVLGVGGMGVVVAATHMHLDQRVALKFMLPDAFQNPEALARFQREARAAVKLKSEHVARVLDTGMFDNNSPYIVMEYLEGTDLAGELEKHGPLPVPLVTEYIVHASEALAEAHSLGIVHRDLKPANLFLTRRADGSPLVKVLDFGISKANSLTEGGLGMTKTASMMGSPLYMSPEQMRSAKDVDQRTDVWSLGIIMYELLGGRVPFNSDTLGGLLSSVMMDAHQPLEQVRPDLPRELCAVVNRCLEKDTSRRLQSVAELAVGLRPFCPTRALPIIDRIANMSGGRVSSLPQLAQTGATHPGAISSPGASPGQTSPGWGATGAGVPPKSSSTALILGGCAAALVVLVAAGLGARSFLRSGKASAEQPTTAASATVATTPPSATAVTAPALTAPTVTALAAAAPPASGATAATAAQPSHPTAAATGKASSGHPAASSSAPPPSAKPAATAAAPTATAQKPGILDTSN